MARLLIIDGNSIANRAFYGIRALSNREGTPTNAIYGFLNIMLKTVDERHPNYLCVAFDLKKPTFRHKAYSLYKAQRKPMPEELSVQLPLLQEVLGAMNIPCLTAEGYEADDIIGTISLLCQSNNIECEILTGDKDDLQLISPGTKVLLTTTRVGNTETELYSEETVIERYGITPRQIIDLKGLMGDASDNIPGVKGIGEKTALSLLQRFGTIENLYDSYATDPTIKGALLEKLQSSRDDAVMSKELATIFCSVPMDFEIEQAAYTERYSDELLPLLKVLELYKLIERLNLQQVASVTNTFDVKWIGEDDFYRQIEENHSYALYVADGGSCALTTNGEEVCFFDALPEALYRRKDIRVLTHDAYSVYQLYPSLEGICFDSALAAYLLDVLAEKYTIDDLAEKYLSQSIASDDEKEYMAKACISVFALSELLLNMLCNQGMEDLFSNVEIPLSRVLADMHDVGIGVDYKILEQQSKMLGEMIDEQAKTIYEMAGEEFNINSPKQLGVILFEKLGLPAKKKTKSGYSTNADVLEKLRFAHPIVESVLNYRQMMKLKSTYTDGLAPFIEEDGRIHTHFHQTVTATGRLSSTEPNLQNIPVRTEEARMIRKAFIAREGYHFLSADYSQIELRILAHISGDKEMIAAFTEGLDIHTRTAALIFDVPIEEVTSMMRSSAKAINFGILYGMGDFSLGNDLGISRRQASEYIENYLNTYPKVREYLEQVVEDAKDKGYVQTLFGRKRMLPELKASNFITRSFGERVAKNAPIQGAAADIIKMAMLRVWNRLRNENLKSRLILQVHDELILEVADDEEQIVSALLVQEMEQVTELSVPLPVSVSKARDWYQL